MLCSTSLSLSLPMIMLASNLNNSAEKPLQNDTGREKGRYQSCVTQLRCPSLQQKCLGEVTERLKIHFSFDAISSTLILGLFLRKTYHESKNVAIQFLALITSFQCVKFSCRRKWTSPHGVLHVLIYQDTSFTSFSYLLVIKSGLLCKHLYMYCYTS